jgi:hypothetical protein
MLRRVCSEGLEALFCMLAPLGARHVITGVEHVFAAGFTSSPRIVLEKLNQSAAVRADYFINIVQPPIPQILSRAVQYSHVELAPGALCGSQSENEPVGRISRPSQGISRCLFQHLNTRSWKREMTYVTRES